MNVMSRNVLSSNFCFKNISVYYLQEIISTSKFLLWKELKYFFALISTTITEIIIYKVHFIYTKNAESSIY